MGADPIGGAVSGQGEAIFGAVGGRDNQCEFTSTSEAGMVCIRLSAQARGHQVSPEEFGWLLRSEVRIILEKGTRD
jgi:hypothetical protein